MQVSSKKSMKNLKIKRNKKKLKVRSKLALNRGLPRVSVFRSGKNIYAQLIDDQVGKTLASSSSRTDFGDKKITKSEKASLVGINLAQKMIKLKIQQAKFDRGFYKYEGRVKALCDGLRKEGIKI